MTHFQPRKQLSTDKITRIGFLKVHKCGSSTRANIFFRFGLKNNLTFVLPDKGVFVRNMKEILPVKPTQHYDILACHSVYSRKLFQSLFGKDSVNIAIIREPAERMVSAAYYFRDVSKKPYLLKVPKNNFIEKLIQESDVYDRNAFSYTKNSMGKDFGFSSSISINDKDKIQQHIDMLKKDFKLVLVQERFDESLILMKRNLNWDIADIIYLKQNVNKHEHVTLSSNLTEKLREICFLDYELYGTFYKIFDEKISAEGPEFYHEVEWFKSIVQLVKEFCDAKEDRKTLSIEKSQWNAPFIITQENCAYIEMKPRVFIATLIDRHKRMN